jgi:allantoin racemase
MQLREIVCNNQTASVGCAGRAYRDSCSPHSARALGAAEFDQMPAVRIWYQSFIDPDLHASYFVRLGSYLSEVAAEDVEYEVGGVSPPDVALHRIAEFRCAAQAIDNAIRAEERGFDAVLIGHFQDSGLWEARSAATVPVIGMGEASMLYSLQLGRTFGLVTIDEVFEPVHREQAERYGLADRLAGIATMSTPVTDLVAAFDSAEAYARVRERFERACAPLVAAGAEMIIPAGGLFGLLSAGERDFKVGESVVLNPIAVSCKMAEAMASLRLSNGLGTSRANTFRSPPPQAIAEFHAFARPGG